MAWTYNENDYTERDFPLIPEGDHRIRIKDAELGTSKSSGKDMLTITFEVSGYNSSVWYYIVLDPEKVKETNQRLGEFFKAFDIKTYDVSKCSQWVGSTGGARIKHEEFNGSQSAKIRFFLKREKLDSLPPWKGNDSAAAAVIPDLVPADADFPFDID